MALCAKLNDQKSVTDFCNAASKMHSKVTITALSTIVDARSIMGIMTLDLSAPIELECENEAEASDKLAAWLA